MPDTETSASRTPREVLARYYRAMLDKSADDLADLYAEDAVHEFPFTFPGHPQRYSGRAEVRERYRASWSAAPARVDEIRNVSVHETTDPAVIIAEHVVVGTLPATGDSFTVPGLLILRVHDGHITHTRDYMDGLAVSRAQGR